MRSPSPDGTRKLLTGVPVVITLTLGRAVPASGEPEAGSPVMLSFADLFTAGAPLSRTFRPFGSSRRRKTA